MRRPPLSRADVAAVTVLEEPRRLRPYSCFYSHSRWGRFLCDPVHDYLHPDAGAAICVSVSLRREAIASCAVTKGRVFRALVVGSCQSVLAHYSPSALISGGASSLPLGILPTVTHATSSSSRAPDNRALRKGSYTSALIQRWWSNTASLRATATTARFLALPPPRSAILSP